MSLADNIKKYRKKRGFTQKQLAKAIGVTTVTIQNYENCRREPKIEVLSEIATTLNVSLSELLTDQETLTSILFKFVDKNLFKEMDASNTLEYLSELIDLDFDTLSDALNNNEDISESYLVAILKIIYKESAEKFFDFFTQNQKLISEYWICNNYCKELISNEFSNETSIRESMQTQKNKKNNSYEPLSSHSTSYINKDGIITEVIPKNNGDISENEAILSALNVLRYEGNKQNFVLADTKIMIEEIMKTAKNLITIAKIERGIKISTESTSTPTVTHNDNLTNDIEEFKNNKDK